MAKKQPETMTIEISRYYDRLAWHVWQGQPREANALRALGAWFEPPLRIDESRVSERVARYEQAHAHNQNPMNWS